MMSIPSRSGSAPPSMEAIEKIGLVYRNSSIGDSEIIPQPSSFPHCGSVVNLDLRVNGYCSRSTGNVWKITPHTESADGSVQVNGSIILSHEEEPEDDRSSEWSASASVDDAGMSSGHSGSFDSKQEDFLLTSSPSHSWGHKSMEEKIVSESDSYVPANLSVSTSPVCTNNPTPSLDDSSQVLLPYDPCAAYVQTSSLVDSVKTPTALNSDHQKLHKKEQLNPQKNTVKQPAALPEGNVSPVQGSYAKEVYPRKGHAYGSLNQLHHGSSSVSKAEVQVQPILQTSGFTSPLYAPSTSFMLPQNSCYPNLPLVGFVTQHYSSGEYPFNSAVLPSYLAGYPFQAVPVVSDCASFPSFEASNGNSLHAYYIKILEQFYRQLGVSMQPPPADPYQLQYFQPTMQNSYDAYYEFDPLEERVQFPSVSFVGPVLAEPVAGTTFLSERNNRSLSHSFYGDSGKTHELKTQCCSDVDSHSFLEELKSGKGLRFELSDIVGHICELSTDQHGSRFIQLKLKNCSVEEKAFVFNEVVVQASKLMTDVFGNYVVQKLFEYGSPHQKKDLANQMESKILQLSLQMYGCRVIQKAFEVIELEQKVQLARELEGHVLKCVHDQNGSHVIQKFIECIPADNIEFIISSFRGQVANLSMHRYGCQVIQRVLKIRDDALPKFIVNEILDSVHYLAQDHYGNYVTQQVLEQGTPRERAEIIKKLSRSILQLSQHKFASNVVEKCLELADATARDMLIRDIVGNPEKNDNILIMIKDRYANYVVQKVLQKCTCEQRKLLLGLIRNHHSALKECTYGKHIVARLEQQREKIAKHHDRDMDVATLL